MERSNLNRESMLGKKPYQSLSKNDPHYERDEEDTLSDKNDTQLHEAIMSALISENRIKEAQVFASVKKGVVYLTGSVPEMKMKLFAEEAIEKIPGVRSVDNNITISSPPDGAHIGAFSASEKIM